MDKERITRSKSIRKRKATLETISTLTRSNRRNVPYKQVNAILQKPSSQRTAEEVDFLKNHKDITLRVTNRIAQKQRIKDRMQEYEDPPDVLADKCRTLAEALSNSNHLIVYTGAGISTAASIPDYRGTNGIWTLLEQGKDVGSHDLSLAEPTLTHMALYSLYRTGLLKHIVSQNCDGLHIRSGLPRPVLSEVHGNMYLEVCTKCKPSRHYLRLFDVTENTARFSHETLRICYKCNGPLKDTIVHFGERGKLQWPLNWETACEQANMADVILCLGSSLKVLKKYPWLWCMDKRVTKRPKLYIVNLQWTPKDDQATLKINGKCDEVLEQVMAHLGLSIPKYVRSLDPIFYHATALHSLETHTTTQPLLQHPSLPLSKGEMSGVDDSASELVASYSQSENDNPSSSSNKVSILSCSSCEQVHTAQHDCITSRSVACQNDLINFKDNNFCDTSNVRSVSTQCSEVPSHDAFFSAQASCDESKNIKGTSYEVEVEDSGIEQDSTETSAEEDASEHSLSAEGLNLLNVTGQYYHNILIPTDVADTFIIDNYIESCLNSPMNMLYYYYLQQAHFQFNSQVSYNLAALYAKCLNFFPFPVFNPSAIDTFLASNMYLDNVGVMNQQESEILCEEETSCSSDATSVETQEIVTVKETALDNQCSFCSDYYYSSHCIFYVKYHCISPETPVKACLCCEDGNDDDSNENDSNENNEDKDEEEEDNEKQSVRVNPGWFGKGYRKRRKRRS